MLLILPGASVAAVNESLGEQADTLHYRCEIMSVFTKLHNISLEYGEILINEDETVIYHASKAAGEAFSGVKDELQEMYVPIELRDSHKMLIQSVNTYTESARNIEKSLGIYLGEIPGKEEESLALVDESEKLVVKANKLLSQSLGMHNNILALDEVDSSCKKYVASL